MIPDSIVLTTELYRPNFSGIDTVMANRDARIARPVSAVPDTAWSWKAVYRDHMWWHLRGDSIRLGLGSGSYEFIAIDFALAGASVNGTGYWESDAAGPEFIPVVGSKVHCPPSASPIPSH